MVEPVNELYGRWPMEETMTYKALVHVENAVRAYLDTGTLPQMSSEWIELMNLANGISSLMQHVVSEAKARAARKEPPEGFARGETGQRFQVFNPITDDPLLG